MTTAHASFETKEAEELVKLLMEVARGDRGQQPGADLEAMKLLVSLLLSGQLKPSDPAPDREINYPKLGVA